MNLTVFILSLGGALLFGLALVLILVGLHYLLPLQGGRSPLATVAFARLILPGTVIARQALWGIATVVVGVALLLGL